MEKILYLTSYVETNTHGETLDHIFKLKKSTGVIRNFPICRLWFTKEEIKHWQNKGVQINITPYSPGITLF